MNIGYFRVSKEDGTIQDLDRQIEAVQDFFGVTFDKVYKERGSAYDLEKIHRREEFFKLIDNIFLANVNTINGVFSQRSTNGSSESINLFVWDFDRIMRNIKMNLMFLTLCDIFDITIFSYKDGKTQKKPSETPAETFSRYMLNSVHAFSGEQYSYTISTNVKKNVQKPNGVTSSSYGKKWGRWFRDEDGNPVEMSLQRAEEMENKIMQWIRDNEKKGKYGYYKKMQESILDEYGVQVSASYLSKLKRKVISHDR